MNPKNEAELVAGYVEGFTTKEPELKEWDTVSIRLTVGRYGSEEEMDKFKGVKVGTLAEYNEGVAALETHCQEKGWGLEVVDIKSDAFKDWIFNKKLLDIRPNRVAFAIKCLGMDNFNGELWEVQGLAPFVFRCSPNNFHDNEGVKLFCGA